MSYETRLEELRAAYAEARPKSAAQAQEARRWMPGGNTRTVLHLDPFPMVVTGGKGAMVQDLDGQSYIDCAGEFSAGLYGHAHPAVTEAQRRALDHGLALSAPNLAEARLARLMVERFPSLDSIRFCNSGTEANLFALIAAQRFTGRSRIMAMQGAYHGGVLTFPDGPAAGNVPFDVCMTTFNDPEAAHAAILAEGDALAAVIVEPLLGAAGNILASKEFLAALRAATAQTGALLIFDEVKTSRLGAAGLQGQFGITPDMTSFGKYIGGGLSFGAFGGRAGIMDLFDPARPDGLKHAGTFNNNVMSMSGGVAGLEQVFPPDVADSFLTRTEAARQDLDSRVAPLGVSVSGLGSIWSLHLGHPAPHTVAGIDPASARLRTLVHLAALERGLMLTGRGDIYLSLPMGPELIGTIVTTLADCVAQELPFVS